MVDSSANRSSSPIDDPRAPLPIVAQKLSITGSFDPNDFDSFDEDDEAVASRKPESFHIPLESIDKIRQSAIQPQRIEHETTPQMEMVQFDPNDFDSFDEDDDQRQRTSPPVQLPSISIDLSKYTPINPQTLINHF